MNAPHTPPSGAMPPGGSSPDMQAMMNQMMGAQGQGKGQGATPGGLPGMPGGAGPAKPPRPLGTIPQEAKTMAKDVGTGLLSLMPDYMQKILGILPTDTPEEAAHKKQILQRYNQLDADQQAVVQKQMKADHEKRQKEEAERQQKEQEAVAKQDQDELPMPQGKSRDEGGAGQSAKKRTTTKLQNDRKRLSSAG